VVNPANLEWSGGEMAVSQCVTCANWDRGKCPAFPQGIPMEIAQNKFDHSRPYGDETILYRRRATG
jgi:hypothetical protein